MSSKLGWVDESFVEQGIILLLTLSEQISTARQKPHNLPGNMKFAIDRGIDDQNSGWGQTSEIMEQSR
jgi:hypothetical protein